MSEKCDYCGFKDPITFKCKYCNKSFCYLHRLPEMHDCVALGYRKMNHKNSLFSKINGNYSLTILIITLISFILQNIPIIGYYYTQYFILIPAYAFSEPWRLITHIFLHSGIFHITFNMMFLFFIGTELERRIGSKRFLFVYFFSGIVAALGYSLWSIYYLNSPFAPALGASGALFGIFACLAVIAPNIMLYMMFIPVPIKITHALILFALFDLLFLPSTSDLIAHSAHLSGLVAGLIIGRKLKEEFY